MGGIYNLRVFAILEKKRGILKDTKYIYNIILDKIGAGKTYFSLF